MQLFCSVEELSLKFFRYSLDSLKNSPPLFCLLATFFYLGPKNVPSLSHSHSLSPSLIKARSFTHTFFLSLPFSHALNLSLLHFFIHRLFYRSENSLTLSLALSFSQNLSLSLARLSTLSLSLRLNLACTHALNLSSLARWCPSASGEQRVENSFKILPQFSLLSNKIRSSRRRRKKLVFLKKSKNFDEPKFLRPDSSS